MDDSIETETTNDSKSVYVPLNGIFAILAVAGNLVVIATICARTAMRTPINYLIVSIAICDILLPLSGLFLHLILSVNFDREPLGSFACKLAPMVNSTATAVIQFTFIAISIILFKLIVCPTQKPMTRREGIIIAIVIWLVNIFVGIPVWINVYMDNFNSKSYCIYTWTSHEHLGPLYVTLFAMWSFFIPAIWLIITYTIVLWKLFGSYSTIGLANDEIDDREFNRNLLKMMVVTTAVHLICWFGEIVLMLDFRVFNYIRISPSIHLLAYCAALMSAVFKPIIYFVMSAKFRSNTTDMFNCRRQD